MNDVRLLETKYQKQIGKCLSEALPGFHQKFAVLKPSTDYEDSNYSFDLVYSMNLLISVKIRKYKYLQFNDMTIRYRSNKGGITEFDKIKQGYGKIYFYAYESEDRNTFVKVRIVDVDAIRYLITNKQYKVYKNNDGTELAAFSFKDIARCNGAIYKYDKPS